MKQKEEKVPCDVPACILHLFSLNSTFVLLMIILKDKAKGEERFLLQIDLHLLDRRSEIAAIVAQTREQALFSARHRVFIHKQAYRWFSELWVFCFKCIPKPMWETRPYCKYDCHCAYTIIHTGPYSDARQCLY